MPPRSSKHTQLLVVGLVAAATISLAIYFASTPANAKSKKEVVDKGKNKKSTKPATPASKSSSSSSCSSTDSTHEFVGGIVHLDDTPKRSNVTDEKDLHSKIEELDKKGKALFKNKKVCH